MSQQLITGDPYLRWFDDDPEVSELQQDFLIPNTNGAGGKLWLTRHGQFVVQEWTLRNQSDTIYRMVSDEEANYWAIFHGKGSIGRRDEELEV